MSLDEPKMILDHHWIIPGSPPGSSLDYLLDHFGLLWIILGSWITCRWPRRVAP